MDELNGLIRSLLYATLGLVLAGIGVIILLPSLTPNNNQAQVAKADLAELTKSAETSPSLSESVLIQTTARRIATEQNEEASNDFLASMRNHSFSAQPTKKGYTLAISSNRANIESPPNWKIARSGNNIEQTCTGDIDCQNGSWTWPECDKSLPGRCQVSVNKP